ncbi:MAG: DUF262 domain-containing protein [Chloroflexi bacterium]|nr:DUF262 domain-containing protein [Chloroflexota bacterium]
MKMELRSRAIDKIFKRRDRYEIPEWQRDEVWSVEKERALIDTILRGWHLPKLYFVRASDSPETWEVVDGQQRLAAIFAFLDNKLLLSPETQAIYGGPYYKDLPPEVSDRFDDFELDYEEITETEEGEVQEYFQRLQEGLPLTPAERLNAVPGKLTEFVRKLSKQSFFRDKVVLSDARYAYFDVCSKVTAVEIQGFEVGLRLSDLQELLQTNANFSSTSHVAQRVQSTFDYLNTEVFNEPSPLLRNRSIIQSFATLTARLLRSGKMGGMGARLRSFLESFMRDLQREVEKGHEATDKDLLEFQSTISANLRTGPEIRHKVLLKRLLLADISFADVIGPQAITESGLAAGLQRSGESIQSSIYALNKHYQAEHGTDLFKPTNETSQAVSTIGKPTTGLKDYGEFIDALYFLLYEGSGNGQRLGDPLPDVVDDIKDLRTQVRHDVDHGPPSKAKTKMKKLGEVFSKYANVGSPELLRPESFPLVQARILTSVDTTLGALLQDAST